MASSCYSVDLKSPNSSVSELWESSKVQVKITGMQIRRNRTWRIAQIGTQYPDAIYNDSLIYGN